MKIVLFTATGAENLGDELITLCEIQSFRDIVPDIEITLFSHDIQRTKRFLLSQKVTLEGLQFREYFPHFFRKHPLKNIKLLWETLQAIKNTDHVYIGGGGLLYGKTEEGHSPLRLWWMRAIMIRFFKKPLTYLSLGVSAGAEELKPYVGIFDKANITVRDKKSQETLETLGHKSSLLPDPVLAYAGNTKTSKTIGIALRKGFLSDEMLIHVIKKLMSLGYEIILLPHSLHVIDEASHDGYYLQDFLLPGVMTTQSIEQTLSAYKSCHIVIGMRLHSMILSVDHHIPFIGISYGQKTSSLLSELDWPYSLDKNTSAEEILQSIGEIEQNYSALSEQLEIFHTKKKNLYLNSFKSLLGK